MGKGSFYGRKAYFKYQKGQKTGATLFTAMGAFFYITLSTKKNLHQINDEGFFYTNYKLQITNYDY